MPEQSLLISRGYVVRCILAFLALATFFYAILSLRGTILGMFAVPMRFLCWCGVVISLIGVLACILYYSKPRPAVTLRSDGFTAFRYPMKNLSFAWSDIARVEDMSDIQYRSLLGFRFPLCRLFMPCCLTFHLIESAQIKNPLMAYNRSNGVGDVAISGAALGMSKKDLAELIEEYRCQGRQIPPMPPPILPL